MNLDKNDTATFEGVRSEFATRKEGIKMKIKSNPYLFPSETSKINYIYSRISEDCQAHFDS